MAGIVVSASKGVIGPILDKLTKLVEDKCANLMGVSSDIVFLRDELCTINALLEKLEDTDELDPLVKDWRNQVREMGYDIEDLIDTFVHHAGSGDEKAGFIDKVSHFLETLMARLEAAKQIKELKTRLKEINERRKRYKFGDCISSSTYVAIDPPLSALYQETANLVGIEGPRVEVIELLTDTDQQLKVLSIIGFGGLGKTTLAMEVYRKIGKQFDITSFVSVSQRPDIRRLLNGLLSTLKISSPTFEVKDIIDTIRLHLQSKRFLVVVDDLWDAPTWDIIRSTFPENGLGCRVIVTTRVEDVASWACCNHPQFIYRMKPLADQDSRRLFFTRIFGSEDRCPSQYREVAAQILKKCSGLPLAVVTIASLLANQPMLQRKEWESIRNSIGAQGAGRYPTLEGMRQILYLSYKDLPHHLRTCFLYLGIYPEDYPIWRDDLIRQWVAEGFVHHLRGQNSHDVAKGYFNEHINRSLIQPAKTEYGEVVSCRVHDMMLDLILSKCAEDNFASVAYNLEEIMTGRHEYKVRRLSLDLRFGDGGDATISETAATRLSQVRSLQLFGRSISVLPLFKYLRVLMVRLSATSERRVDLTAVKELLELRYLRVEAYQCWTILELPTEFQGLRCLATLHLDGHCTNGTSLPLDIVHLPRLSHLIVPRDTMLPAGIGNMKSLCTLRLCDVFDMTIIKDLGELTNLRELQLRIRLVPTATVRHALVTSLGKLCKLIYLSVTWTGHTCYDENDWLGSLSHPFLHIEKLHLGQWRLPRVPKWICGDLQNLRYLHLCVEELSTDDVRVLGELPALFNLHILVQCAAVVFDAVGFPSLQSVLIWFDGAVASHLCFKAGVMPNLRYVNLMYINEWSGTAPVGMEHLLNLRGIHVLALDNDGVSIGRVFWEAIQAHRSCPTLQVNMCIWPPKYSP